MDELIDKSKWGAQSRRGAKQAKYDLFYHPMFFPNNTWVWKFIPGVVVGFVGCLLLFGDRLRRNRSAPKGRRGATPTNHAAQVESAVDVKLMLVVNSGLKGMKAGKMGAQCGHAAGMVVKQLMKRQPRLMAQWEHCGTKKICVSGQSVEHLEALSEQARRVGILVTPVFDAGKTQVAEGSLTVVAIGPAEAAKLHAITGDLKLVP